MGAQHPREELVDPSGCFHEGRGSPPPGKKDRRRRYTNYLDLLVAFLALQMFVMDKTNLTLFVQIDSVMAMTYINRREECVFCV